MNIGRSVFDRYAGTVCRQRGISIVLVAVALLALIGIGGLALDSGHMVLNKGRLQNTVDAAALQAAKVIDDTDGDTAEATTAALAIFQTNADGEGNAELARAYNAGDIQVTVQYSATLNPFSPGSPDGPYVRVIATNFEMDEWFAKIVGFANKEVAARAVAGPSPSIDTACNIAPMMVCGDPDDPPTDDEDTSYYGYDVGQVLIMKHPGHKCAGIGPGNFQLVNLEGSQGGSDLRDNMAGAYEDCHKQSEDIETKTGQNAGPVEQGLNTRFGEYSGPVSPEEYPPDVRTAHNDPPILYDNGGTTNDCSDDSITYDGDPVATADHIGYSYADYEADVRAETFDYPPHPDGIGRYSRRVLALPVGDCTETTNGNGSVPLLGFMCMFLLQPVNDAGGGGGGNANAKIVYGEMIENCQVGGKPGPEPGKGPLYIIQLYKDPNSADS